MNSFASLASYRTVIYAGTLVTGLTGLIYQVVWQKYLTFVIGSDARSVSLVVAVFLAGLAAGYRFWGRTSERLADRRKLLRLYGALEIGIGLYAALFLPWLDVVRVVANRGPAWLLTDVAVTVLALGLPTFLMGATIPLLVSVVPERPAEVHLAHARIYGLNTLGACVGAFASSFFLIPSFGLPTTLLGAASANLLVGLVFLLNPLAARVTREETIPEIPNRFSTGTIYLYTLITGTVTLSLEVLLVRVLNLTLGAGPHNFAIVVGVFIFGLALGSLAISERMLSVRVLFRALTFLMFYAIALFYSIPYWPYWLNTFRVLLRSIPFNYGVYLAGVTLFLAALLIPLLVPFGFMLPLAYALLPKDTADYGKKCGWLYFYNTLGTALGAVLLSYVLLSYFDLDTVFKIDVALLAILALVLFLRERRRALAVAVALAVVAFLAGPRWDRDSHYLGLFGVVEPAPFHFTGLFRTPRLVTEVDFTDDGPDTSISVTSRAPGVVPFDTAGMEPPDLRPASRALMNNGRSEGDTTGDYSTMVLAGILPYLHAPDRPELEIAIVGLGTGMTAGVLAAGRDVAHETVVEISSTLIDAAPYFDEYAFGLTSNPRASFVRLDGFRYFSRLDNALDVVVSEPSVPWVAGVENLFTPEYYALVDRALVDDGVFMQWFPMYSVDPPLFRTILGNLSEAFPELRMFRLSGIEVGVIASRAPISDVAAARRFAEPAIAAAAARLEWTDAAQLELIRLFDGPAVRALVASGERARHTLDRPGLSYAADRSRFLSSPIDPGVYLDPRLLRQSGFRAERASSFERLLATRNESTPCALRYNGAELFCEQLARLHSAWSSMHEPDPLAVERRLEAHDVLRQQGFAAPSPEFLLEQGRIVVEHYPAERATSALRMILVVAERDGLWDAAQATLALFAERGLVDGTTAAGLSRDLERGRAAHRQYVERLRAQS